MANKNITLNRKIKKIKEHKDYISHRAIETILNAIQSGVKLNEKEKLFELVEKAYEIGKHRSPCYIKNTFKRTMIFLEKELNNYEKNKTTN